MLDERQIELIQADVDGELPADQRAELSRLLLGNSEARALHDDLRKLTRMFSTLPRHEPPVGLERAVVDSIQWRAPSRRPAAAWRESAPRIAATVAGAALLVAALYHLGLPFGANVDRSELSGTMASPAGGRMPKRRRSPRRGKPRAARRPMSRSNRARTTARRRPAPMR